MERSGHHWKGKWCLAFHEEPPAITGVSYKHWSFEELLYFPSASCCDDSTLEVIGPLSNFCLLKATVEIYRQSRWIKKSYLPCNMIINLQRGLSLWSVYELWETNVGLLSVNMTNIHKVHLSSTGYSFLSSLKETFHKVSYCQRLISIYETKDLWTYSLISLIYQRSRNYILGWWWTDVEALCIDMLARLVLLRLSWNEGQFETMGQTYNMGCHNSWKKISKLGYTFILQSNTHFCV